MRKFFPYIILLINALPCLAQQNIYDLEHSRRYANYLLKQKNYILAADEWERIVKLQPTDTNRYILLRTYRLAGNYDNAEQLAQSILTSTNNIITWHNANEEYYKSLILSEKYSVAQLHFIGTYMPSVKNASEPEDNAPLYYFQAKFLNYEWKSANEFYRTHNILPDPQLKKSYENLINRSENLKYKSPALAAGLGVFPGLGKVYCGDWKDGAIEFVTIGTSAWQAYSGFSEKGTRSVYGWIFGGLAAGFYTGSIYGSYKAAIRFNNRQQKQLADDAKKLFFSAY